MKKLFKTIFIILFITIFACSYSFASNTSNTTEYNKGDVTMKLVEDNVCNIKFGTYGEFEKKLIKYDTNNKTVDIGLTVKNNAEPIIEKNAEVVLLIDSSRSMSVNPANIPGQDLTRKEAVLASAETLINKLLEANPDTRIGIVEFATNAEVNDEGYTEEGTDKDAKVITENLTNDKDTLLNALDKVSEDVMGPRTNVEVGLDAANSLFEHSTANTNEKFIITLTDAIPNTSRGVTMDTYSEKTTVPTKNKLIELDEQGVNLISILIEMSDNEILDSKEDPKPTYREVAERIFGTVSNPTAGSVYYISDEEVENTVTNEIYSSLISENVDLNNIVIKDYFPQDIIDNFEYAELTEATIGNVTAKVNTEDNSITWTIDKLEPGETATFSYRLTLKNTVQSDVIGVNLPTNENVEITYKENGTPGSEENDESPIIALDVLPKDTIPQTGIYTGLYIVGAVLAIGVIGSLFYTFAKRNSF